MLEASRTRILAELPDSARVLDVGGGALPFPRADAVLDLLPYERRGMLGWDGEREQERFSAESWFQRDICEREPWPFAEHQFDFAICSHTLEDVRDPLFVCGELARVARAGYVEVPSLAEELSWGVQGPWAGWGHHHWLVQVADGGLEFIFKSHVVNRPGSHLPADHRRGRDPADRVSTLWWQGRLAARERFMLTADELDGYLSAALCEAGLPPDPASGSGSPPRAGLDATRGRRRWWRF